MESFVAPSDLGPAGAIRRPGYETAAAKIAEFITTSGLRPGDRLPTERALGERLGVSRTVVREAVKVLTATGLVRARQGSGLYVAAEPRPFATAAIDLSMPVDPAHMVSLFEFRCMLEMQTARLAAERITPREVHALQEAVTTNRLGAESDRVDQFNEGDVSFHQGIAEASRNPFLAASVATVFRLQRWAIAMVLSGVPGSLLVAAEQHAAILEAIRSGQSEAAAAAMQTHVQTVMSAYQQEVRRRLVGAAPPD
jgi:DNA-binding FadR family transcriptional regulator